jgi:two-component system, cell cycle response regulator
VAERKSSSLGEQRASSHDKTPWESPATSDAISGVTSRGASDDVGAASVAAADDFLSTFGDDATDVLGTGAVTSGGAKLQREPILTVLAGPQIGLARIVDAAELVIGRGQGADLLLADPGLSRRHCRVIRQDDVVFIEDLDSANGTFVDGELVKERRPCDDGARIHLGRHTVLSLSRQDPLERDAARQLYESSMRDPLTDLYNRRFFDQRLREEYAFASRHNVPLSVILLDLDHFKRINDTYGHPVGDDVLMKVAGVIKGCVRREDVACRFGGEEFAVIARAETHDGARAVAERMRKRIEETPVHHEGGLIQVTTSAGIATVVPPQIYETPAALLAAADQALYRAKAKGRNRCEG